jgi:hypothetical protein
MRPVLRAIAVLLLLSRSLLGQAPSTLSRSEARKIIVELNREWGKARVAFDKPTFEKMLAPDFYVQLADQKLTRQEFIDEISAPSRGGKLTRFDVEVLTVEPSGDAWVAVIEEKLEFARGTERGTSTASGSPVIAGRSSATGGWLCLPRPSATRRGGTARSRHFRIGDARAARARTSQIR